MRSLFVRILLWVLVLTAAAGVTPFLVNQWLAQPNFLNAFVGGLLGAHLDQARAAYERGGRDELRAFLARFEQSAAGGLHLTDADGRDVLTGRVLAPRLAIRGRAPSGGIALVDRLPMFTRVSADGRYRVFAPLAVGGGVVSPIRRPQLWLAALAVIGLCWGLARHLSRPVLELQRAVERFGRGDTGSRTRSTRSDEIGRLAREFDAMADRLEELVQGQRRLLLDISHELRSPLARLATAAWLVRADPRDAASLDQIDLEVARLNQLIGEILESAQPESAAARRRFAPVALDQLTRDIVERCRIEADEGRRIELSEPASVQVSGDAELLRRAIENVLRNAVRYAPAGTAIDVGLRAASDGASVLTVRDRGPGVPDAALPHLFTPFYRLETDRDREAGGVGLGLAIARRAIELHRGRISARNVNPGLEVEMRFGEPVGGHARPHATTGAAVSAVVLVMLMGADLRAGAGVATRGGGNDTRGRVTVERREWLDASRNRTVPYKLYVPDGDGPFPIVVHSHGLGGNREGSTYILEEVAASGFVVVALQHDGSDTGLLRASGGQSTGGPRRGRLAQASRLRDAAIERYRDLPFAIRQIDAMQTEPGPLRGKLDLARLGMSGHSFGALSTLVAAGQRVPGEPEGAFSEPRIRAAIAYSPNKPRNADARTALAAVSIPMLHLTGTEDRTPFDLEATPWERTIPFQVIDRRDQFLIVLTGGDHMIFNGQRLAPRANAAADAAHRRVIVDETVRFWRAYLGDDRQALQALCALPARVKGVADGYAKAARCGPPTPLTPPPSPRN